MRRRMMTGRDVEESDEDIIDDDDEEDLNISDEDDAFFRKQPNGKIRGKSSTLLSRRKRGPNTLEEESASEELENERDEEFGNIMRRGAQNWYLIAYIPPFNHKVTKHS